MKVTQELKDAIRAITVEAPDGQPNGPTEQALCDLEATFAALRPWREKNAQLDGACSLLAAAASRLAGGMADDAGRLRRAADAFFQENFAEPEK